MQRAGGKCPGIEHLNTLVSEVFIAVYRDFQDGLAQVLHGQPDLQAGFLRQSEYVVADCLDSLDLGRLMLNEKKAATASALGVTAAYAAVPPGKLMSAWMSLVDIFLTNLSSVDAVYDYAGASTTSGSAVNLIIQSLHRGVSERSRIMSEWYQAALTQRAERMHIESRKRMARELHDWVGSNLSLAKRKLELYEVESESDGGTAGKHHLSELHSVLGDMFDRVRQFAIDLRLSSPVSSIVRELRSFVDSVSIGSIDVDVFAKGDEDLLDDHVRVELFIVLREALRNVFAHSGAGTAFVLVEVSFERVCAVVQDDGHGFVFPAESAFDGTGVSSMRERVEGLNGAFLLSTAPMRGTRVEVWIPIEKGER